MTANQEIVDALSQPYWRLNNLYYIQDKHGRKVKFNLNWAQQELYEEMWYCNIILKARQLGMSTFICLLFLDRCLFNEDMAAGIVAHTLEDSQQLFRRVKYAYDNLDPVIKALIPARNDSSQMLTFSNGSSLRVGTSLRSSTFQYLHISEFGKICARYPDKAREIVTGTLNTVAPGQYIFIESTAEGKEGYFYDMCKMASDNLLSGKTLSQIDFKFHFFPWYKEPSYRIGNTFSFTQEQQDYFDHLSTLNIEIDLEQKNWYAYKQLTQQEDMKREFPSTPQESWEVSNEGHYYSKQMNTARHENRVGFIPYDDSLPVYTAWDLGYNDSTAIWFFQLFGKEIRLIDYLEGSGESLTYWVSQVQKKDYIYEKHLAPHDIKVHEYSTGTTRQTIARKLGLNLIPVPRTEIIPGIDVVRGILNRCWFDEKKCAQGIKCLENYKKEWDERRGCWRSQPLHDFSSHGADAFRTLATGLPLTGQRDLQAANLEKQQSLSYLQNRFSPTSVFY